MKIKTSATLSKDLLDELDKLSSSYGSRSELVEAALRAFITQHKRAEQEAKDLAIFNRLAGRMNDEAADVLEYQVIP